MRTQPLLRLSLLVLPVLFAGCVSSAARTASDPLARALSGMIWPLPISDHRSLTSEFGPRGRSHHHGLDIDGHQGDPIFAARDGRVHFSGWRNGYGNTVVLDHGSGVTTLYAHAAQFHVRTGDSVRRGQTIGEVGATGNARGSHLHFEIAWAGRVIDPSPLLPKLRGS